MFIKFSMGYTGINVSTSTLAVKVSKSLVLRYAALPKGVLYNSLNIKTEGQLWPQGIWE